MFYEKYLNANEIEARQKKFGFPDARLIELLIYDYEIFRQLLAISDRFYLKGGAAAQLYMTLPEQRASKDIDLVTDLTPEEIEEIFTKRLNRMFLSRKHVPAKIRHQIPLVTYLVEADSVTEPGTKVEIKVDILFEDIRNYRMSMAPACELFALNTSVDLPAVSLGSLAGDKLLTLAHKSIGLPEEKLAEYPKQVYDLARIIQKMDRQGFADLLYSFERIIKTETRVRNLENTASEIIRHILSVLDDFARLDTPDCRFRNYVNDFQSAYVNAQARKTNAQWIIDALLLIQLLKSIYKALPRKADIDTAYSNWSGILEEIGRIRSLNAEDRLRIREALLGKLKEALPSWKRLKAASEERLYLELKRFEQA
jgi:hypothetical protein